MECQSGKFVKENSQYFLNRIEFFLNSDLILGIIVLLLSSITSQMTAQIVLPSQATKLVKSKHVNVTLRCSLLEKHEVFNQNATVSWWFKKTCKLSCWNQPEEMEWTEIKCHGKMCNMVLELDDETAENGFYMCKLFPYKTSTQTVLQIEVTKTFQLEIFGKKF